MFLCTPDRRKFVEYSPSPVWKAMFSLYVRCARGQLGWTITRALCTMFCVLVFFVFPLVVSSDSCKTLDGTWYNQLGSEVILKHHSDGKLVGEYRTAAERHAGAAGQQHSTVLGKLN